MKFTSRRVRDGERHPLLQGHRQHRHPRREPVDRRAASCWRRRRSAGETASGWQQVTFSDSGVDPAEHHLRRVLLRPQGALLQTTATSTRRLAAARRWRHRWTARRCTPCATRPRRQRRLQLRRQQHLPVAAPSAPRTTGSTSSSHRPRPRVSRPTSTATAGYASAAVSWTAPTGGQVTKYTVTPYIGATAQTPTVITGDPAPHGTHGHRADQRHDLHLHRHRVATRAERACFGAVQPGHAAGQPPSLSATADSRAGCRPGRSAGSCRPSRERRQAAQRHRVRAARRRVRQRAAAATAR